MRVGIYIRTAAGGTNAIGCQADALRSALDRQGLQVAAEFVDQDYPGTTLDRPGLAALRHAVRAGTIDALWCRSPDRLWRDYRCLAALLDELDRHQVPVRFLDPADPDGSHARRLAQLWAMTDQSPVRRSEPPRPHHSGRLGPQGHHHGR
jgi:site-specific DNA recombinase